MRVGRLRVSREVLVVACLVALAFAVRVGLVLGVRRVVWGDEPFYLWLGRNWLTGQGYSFTGYTDVHHTPGYPFLSGVFYLLTGNLETASDICYVLFGTLLALPVYWLARRIYDRQAGYLSLLLLAVYPALSGAILFWGTMTEPPYYFFAYAGMFAVLAGMERRKAWALFLGGLAVGAAYIVRPEGIAYFVVVALYLAIVRLFQKRLLSRRFLAEAAALALGFAVFFAPYAVYTRAQTGQWMISEKAGVTYVTSMGLAYGDTVAFDKATWGLDRTGLEVFFFSRESYNVSIIDQIAADPMQFVKLVAQNVKGFIGYTLSPRMLPAFLLPLLALALFRRFWDRQRARKELLLVLSLLPVMAFLVFFIQERYIAALLPTLIIWLAVGLRELARWLAETAANLMGRRPSAVWVNLALALPVAAVCSFLVAMQPKVMAEAARGSFRYAHRSAGEWLASQPDVRADTIVMSRYPAIAFYAGARWEPTPNAEWPQVLAYARYNDVDYVAVDERETEKMRPQFAFLLDERVAPPELDPVHTDTSEGARLVIFRLRPER